jgi:hypothetical protein
MYLLSFDNDSILSGRTFNNDFYGSYNYTLPELSAPELSIEVNGMSYAMEYGDGKLYIECLEQVQNFMIAETLPLQLDLFYNDGKKSLRFVRIKD